MGCCITIDNAEPENDILDSPFKNLKESPVNIPKINRSNNYCSSPIFEMILSTPNISDRQPYPSPSYIYAPQSKHFITFYSDFEDES